MDAHPRPCAENPLARLKKASAARRLITRHQGLPLSRGRLSQARRRRWRAARPTLLLALKHNQGPHVMLARVTLLFPLWAVLVSIAAYFALASFSGIAPHVTTLLTIIMLDRK